MKLQIGPWVIVSDKYQYKLSQLVIRKTEDKGDKTTEVFEGYYTQFEGVLMAMLEKELNDQDVTDIRELIDNIQNLRIFVRKASTAIIEEIKKLPHSLLKDAPDTDGEDTLDKALNDKTALMKKVDAKIENKKKPKVEGEEGEQEPKKRKSRKLSVKPKLMSKRMTKKGRVIDE